MSVLSQRFIYFNLYVPLSPSLEIKNGVRNFKTRQTTRSEVAGAAPTWGHSLWKLGPVSEQWWAERVNLTCVSSWWGRPLRKCRMLFRRLTDCCWALYLALFFSAAAAAKPLPPNTAAQKAELTALTKALCWGKETLEIHTQTQNTLPRFTCPCHSPERNRALNAKNSPVEDVTETLYLIKAGQKPN